MEHDQGTSDWIDAEQRLATMTEDRDAALAKLAEAEANQSSLWAAIHAGQRALADSGARLAVAVEALRKIEIHNRYAFDSQAKIGCSWCGAEADVNGNIDHDGCCSFAALSSPSLAPMARLLEAVRRAMVTPSSVVEQSDATALKDILDAARALWGGGGERE